MVGTRFVVAGLLLALSASAATAQPRSERAQTGPAVYTLGVAFTLHAPTRDLNSVVYAGKRSAGARNSSRSRLEAEVLSQINGVRARRHLRPLRFSAHLNEAADSHSRAMARRGFFSHESVDGTSFWKRVRRFYPQGRHRFWSVGENLLWASPSVAPGEAMRMWMASPPHRANLLTGRWREIGLSAVHVQAGPGVYGGREVTIVTADFGVRR